jgi:hypothetical protein
MMPLPAFVAGEIYRHHNSQAFGISDGKFPFWEGAFYRFPTALLVPLVMPSIFSPQYLDSCSLIGSSISFAMLSMPSM